MSDKPSNPRLHQPDGEYAAEARKEDCVTLLDMFANGAMQGLIAAKLENVYGNNDMPIPDYIAELSYQMAESMLKQREKLKQLSYGMDN